MNKVRIDKYQIPFRYMSRIASKFPDVYMLMFSTEDRYIEIDLDEIQVLKKVNLDEEL